ncbi:MAG: hypothetical protein WDN26_03680 [Chitinophagaceae bacterium]
MYNIILVCTIHSEIGKCNSSELHQIIESINPDVIFEEICPDLFDRIYKKNDIPFEPLEIKAIKRYLQDHAIEHIPVDIDPDPNLSLNDIKYMFDAFKKYDVYKKLDIEQYKMTETDGFSFLNSKRFTQLHEEKKLTETRLMEFMMTQIQQTRIYKLFYEEQETRENSWLQNIYNYSKKYTYNKAIFYCGASHRKSIKQKIEEFERKEQSKLIWTFYGD